MSRSSVRRTLAAIGLGGVLAGAVIASPPANADPVDKYTALEAPVVCAALTGEPTLSTVTNLFGAIIRDTAFTVEQTARVVVTSVQVWCPENRPVLDRFVQVYGGGAPQTTTADFGPVLR